MVNEEGFQRLFSCYNNGINRLNTILKQDVYKIESRDVKGRRARDITSYKSQDFQIPILTLKSKKGKAKVTNDDDDNNKGESSITTKRIYRKTSEIEKQILEKILSFNTFPENE